MNLVSRPEPAGWPFAATPEDLRAKFGDETFGNGLYRILSDQRAADLEREISHAYPDVRKVTSFATTWLGDAIALSERSGTVVIFEPGTGEMLNTEKSFQAFQHQELIENTDAALASDFYQEWLDAGNPAPGIDECVGFRRPLFQGGEESIGNLEVINIDVYWTVTAPFIARVRAVMWAERSGGTQPRD